MNPRWALALVSLASTLHANPPDGAPIMAASEQRIKSLTEHTRYRMELFDAQGSVQHTREVAFYYKRQPDLETTLIKFTSPPVLQGTGLLIVDHGTAVNDIWMYLPATRRIRRIAGTEKSNWFMGTEFTHEDFEDYQSARHTFTVTADSASCGIQQSCVVVSATAHDAAEQAQSGYSKKVYWLEKQSLYPIRIDYFDRTGSQVKQLDAYPLTRAGAYWRAEHYDMRNVTNGRKTRLTTLTRVLDAPLDDWYVSQRFLRTE